MFSDGFGSKILSLGFRVLDLDPKGVNPRDIYRLQWVGHVARMTHGMLGWMNSSNKKSQMRSKGLKIHLRMKCPKEYPIDKTFPKTLKTLLGEFLR